MFPSFSLWTWAVNFRHQHIQFKFNKISLQKNEKYHYLLQGEDRYFYSIENINWQTCSLK